MNDTETLSFGRWSVRIRETDRPGRAPAALLLHGFTGDEDVMWIFASRLPEGILTIAPRGLHGNEEDGYSWVEETGDSLSPLEAFRSSMEALLDLLEPHPDLPPGDYGRIHLMGFSQGAALAYAFALTYPERVASLVGLAGFLPQGAESLAQGKPLDGRPVFVAHGTRDDRVSVEHAREAVRSLERAGASVTYCEDDVGHKLSADCLEAMTHFYDQLEIGRDE